MKNLEDSLNMKVIEHGTQDQLIPAVIRMRFGNQSVEDIRGKVSSPIRGKSSERVNRFATESFRQYLREISENVDFENFGTAKLADILCGFYINARTKEGEMYKLKSLMHLRSSLSRYLKSQSQSRNMDIISGVEFREANRVFKAALSEIKASGKGDIVHHAIISRHDLFKLYSSSQMSPDSPVGLQNRVQMNLRLSFSHLMNKNMDKMTKDTFLISTYDDGRLYVHRHPHLDRVGSTCDAKDDTSAQCHMVQDKNNTFLCPVSTLQIYLDRLHPMCDRLWQHPVERDMGDIWYLNSPMGHNTLAKFMSNLSTDVPLSRTYTNNSIRLTGNAIRANQRPPLNDVMTVGPVKIE